MVIKTNSPSNGGGKCHNRMLTREDVPRSNCVTSHYARRNAPPTHHSIWEWTFISWKWVACWGLLMAANNVCHEAPVAVGHFPFCDKVGCIEDQATRSNKRSAARTLLDLNHWQVICSITPQLAFNSCMVCLPSRSPATVDNCSQKLQHPSQFHKSTSDNISPVHF